MRKTLLFFLLILCIFFSACSSYKKGLKHYKNGEYDAAIHEFEKALSSSKNKNNVNFYLGQSYRKSNRIREATPYYEKVFNKKISGTDRDDHEDDAKFYYGIALQAQGKYEEAKEQFQNYMKYGRNIDYVKRAQKEIKNIDQIKNILSKKYYFEVKACDQLNTEHAEYAPLVHKNTLLLSAAYKEGSFPGDGQQLTGIYQYKLIQPLEFENKKKAFSSQIFNASVNEAMPTFSHDGETLIFAMGNSGKKKGRKNVKLYISEKTDEAWSPPLLLEEVSSLDDQSSYGNKKGKKTISKAEVWDSSPCFSPDGQTLYFASNRMYDDRGNRSKGRIDLFRAQKLSNGKWGNVRNMGEEINSEGDDMFPYVSDDGKLYFASDGHAGLGGLDIFVATKINGVITVKNMGPPINSIYDDLSLTFASDSTGYFASNRNKKEGDDDIYFFEDKTPHTKTVNYFLAIKTMGKDTRNNKIYNLANSKVKIINDQNQLIHEFTTDQQGLTDTIALKDYSDLLIIAENLKEKDKYLTARELFIMAGKKIPYELLTEPETDTTLILKLELEKIYKDLTFAVDIFYDYNKWDIRPEAAKTLNTLVTFLNDNPQIKVELGSHTDSRGTNADNEILAQNRAQSAVDYIISKGIERERLIAKGYGEEVPRKIDKNLAALYPYLNEEDVLNEKFINSYKDTKIIEELHQINRRTEIRIIEIKED